MLKRRKRLILLAVLAACAPVFVYSFFGRLIVRKWTQHFGVPGQATVIRHAAEQRQSTHTDGDGDVTVHHHWVYRLEFLVGGSGGTTADPASEEQRVTTDVSKSLYESVRVGQVLPVKWPRQKPGGLVVMGEVFFPRELVPMPPGGWVLAGAFLLLPLSLGLCIGLVGLLANEARRRLSPGRWARAIAIVESERIEIEPPSPSGQPGRKCRYVTARWVGTDGTTLRAERKLLRAWERECEDHLAVGSEAPIMYASPEPGAKRSTAAFEFVRPVMGVTGREARRSRAWALGMAALGAPMIAWGFWQQTNP